MAQSGEEHVDLACGCRASTRDGRLLGFKRACDAASRLFAEMRAAVTEEQADAVERRLHQHGRGA